LLIVLTVSSETVIEGRFSDPALAVR